MTRKLLVGLATGSLLLGMAGMAKADSIAVPSQFSGTDSTAWSYYPIGGFPLPYGVTNNISDIGWIWVPGNYFIARFNTPTAIEGFRVWSVYGGSSRGARWEILSSDNGTTFTHETFFDYETTLGVGVDDSGQPRPDFTGWYEVSFNAIAAAHEYWKVTEIALLDLPGRTWNHSPRSAQVEFYAVPVPEPASLLLLGTGLIGAVRAVRKRRQ